ncbi:dipeptidyl peptidase IV [Purpureocillium lavendulum]|uniref:Dipeptidyl peptidase IV n=1 Tax=Purpureocillium lavendulum TaxID=1247861 RepID=A0AB34FUM9_9HYPO|nr:dipeptidyl peptidase IV [Purpureocillium lavendulum]
MTVKQVARYGDWKSPITVDSIVSKYRAISAPRVAFKSGRAFYRETTADDRSTIVEVIGDAISEVLPAPYSVTNRVYEYGASLYDVLADDRIIFSHSDDSVCLLDPDTQEVTVLVRSPVLRYASFSAAPTLPWVLAIEEDHAHDTPREIRNYVVAINVQSGEVRRVVTGSDFYYMPRFSLDGRQLVWMQWDHPEMCFDAAELYLAAWRDGAVANRRLVAGKGYESVGEPRWGRDGTLFFAKEAGPYRQLFRLAPGAEEAEHINLKGLENSEIGAMGLMEGSCTYVPLSNNTLVASATREGDVRLIVVNLQTNEWHQIADDDDVCQVSGDAMARLDDTSFLVVSSGAATPTSIRKFDLAQPQESKVIRKATDESYPPALYSKAEHITIQSKGSSSRSVHAFLFMPRNPDYVAPEDQRPPLIIVAHGGPTGRTGSGLDLRTQYWTSRGYALLALNYTGSTGYGRDYRNALFNGGWGALDADDAAEFAQHLASAGCVKPDGIAITGISAGGYNTLQVLTRHSSLFAAGLCVSGISELERFDGKTHKLESDYVAKLLLPKGGLDDEARRRLYRERSALYHVERIKSPLVLLHGRDDSVVPVEQATLMADKLRDIGRDVGIVVVDGEGHMMAQPPSVRLWLEEEEKLWRRTLL